MTHDEDKPLTPAQVRQKFQKGLMDYMAGNDPGPLVFRLKPTKKAGETYPLKLTQQQRETLLRTTQLSRGLTNKIKKAGDGTQVVGVTRNELDKLNDAAAEAAVYAPSADKRRLMAVQGRVLKLFEDELDQVFGVAPPKPRRQRSTKSDLLYQFKIRLLDLEPAIWRRIQVPDCTLLEFHEYIQAAFGWWNYHLHQFEIDGVLYSEPAPDGDDFGMEFEDDSRFVLSKLLPKSAARTRWIYEYDFGDGWRHDVLFEGSPPRDPNVKFPLCLEGERACPPEDCGGTGGYVDYLAAIADPEHEDHEEMLQWRGPFDPESFDPEKASMDMRKAVR
jgi:Plasmid pRiA4b ORF-3-like protein